MSCLMVVQAEITDPARFREYTAVVPALVARFGGRYRVLGGATTRLEGSGWPECKSVMSEWPSREAALAFWHSPEYQAAARLREGTGRFTIVLLDGIDEPKAPA